MERRTYSSAIRSKKLIREAYVTLLREKPFDKITATEVIRRAGINRSTFYAHYPDVQGIVEEIEREITEQFTGMLEQLDFFHVVDDMEQLIGETISFLSDRMELFRLLGSSHAALRHMEGMKHVLISRLLEAVAREDAFRDDLHMRLRVHLLMNGVIETYVQWLQGELDCSLNEITRGMTAIIQEWMKTM